MISVIIPTLNAAGALKRSLPPLVPGVAAGLVREVIISDAGSSDATVKIAAGAGAQVVRSAMGEGMQSMAGALAARGAWFLFLHADAALDPEWVDEAARAVNGDAMRARVFRLGIDGIGIAPRLRETWAQLRTAWMGNAVRTQGLLISRALYESLGGYVGTAGAHGELIERIGAKRLGIMRARAVVSA